MEDLLIQSDNEVALNYLLNDKKLKGKIDLVYIDPPFSTGMDFKITKERTSTISRSDDGEIAYLDRLKKDEYLLFLKKRLILIRELMSNNGSIYLHSDYKIGHYVKIVMDDVFGQENFHNDITRIKCNPKNFSRIGYGNIKDMILFYSKTSNPIWNEPREDYTKEDIIRLFPKKDKNGRRYTTVPIHAPGETLNGESNKMFKGKFPPKGRHWRVSVDILEQWNDNGLIEWSKNGNPRKIIYQDEQEGKRIQDIWSFKDPQYTIYPTEKNYDMLSLIIKTSSKENSIVLDCFCGSGTTLLAAQNNNRRWIGVDNSSIAIEKTKEKLNKLINKYDFLELNS